MAKKINLVIYGLSVLDNNNKRLNLNAIIHGNSLIEIIKEYIDKNKSNYTNDFEKELIFQFDQYESEVVYNDKSKEEYEILCGRVKTGEYGIESELVNILTGDVYARKAEQADLMPFGFCIAVPRGDVTHAVILLQTMGVYGMKVSLQNHLQKCLMDLNPDFRISFKAIAPKEYIDRYFYKGILKRIRMIRYEILQDVSERMGINYGVKQTKEERIIHKPLGFMERNKKKFQDWRAGQCSYTEIVEMDGYEYDDLKLEFSLNGTDKTFNLKNMDALVVNEDITKKVVQSGGHPVFSSLVPIMKQTAREYLVGMGLLI